MRYEELGRWGSHRLSSGSGLSDQTMRPGSSEHDVLDRLQDPLQGVPVLADQAVLDHTLYGGSVEGLQPTLILLVLLEDLQEVSPLLCKVDYLK